MSEPLRVAVIGCGVVAPAHFECFQRLEGVEVAAACDLVEEKARRLAERFRVGRVATDYREILADPSVQAVSICTDHASHVGIAVDALAAGKHVLCEKALAPNREGISTMLEAGRRHPGQVFGAVFQHRFDAPIRALKALIDEGALGTLVQAAVTVRCHRGAAYYQADAWRGTWALEGGAILINQAIHFVDAFLWVMGGAEAVSGAFANRAHVGVIETEDAVAAAVRFRCGALGTIEATSASNLEWECSLAVHGTEGAIELRDGKPVKAVFRNAARSIAALGQLSATAEPRGPAAGKRYYGSGHMAQIADFVEAVRERRAPFVTVESASHTVEVVLGVYASHREQRWIPLPA